MAGSDPAPIRVPVSAVCFSKLMPVSDEQRELDRKLSEDWALKHGEIYTVAQEGESVLVYTPTFILHGRVDRVGPIAIELLDAGVVFETGPYDKAANAEFVDAQSWPEAVRIPMSSICFSKLMS